MLILALWKLFLTLTSNSQFPTIWAVPFPAAPGSDAWRIKVLKTINTDVYSDIESFQGSGKIPRETSNPLWGCEKEVQNKPRQNIFSIRILHRRSRPKDIKSAKAVWPDAHTPFIDTDVNLANPIKHLAVFIVRGQREIMGE